MQKKGIRKKENCKKANPGNRHQGLRVSMINIFPPSEILKPYVTCYWVCTTDEDVWKEVMFPSGHIELCIDISNGNTIRHHGDQSMTMPRVELLGHLTMPTTATVRKGTTVIVVRFQAHALSLFFPHSVSEFTDTSVDLFDMITHESTRLYDRLMEQPSLEQKLSVLDSFLVQKIFQSDKKQKQFQLLESLCTQISRQDVFDLEDLSFQYGFSERHIQKLFLQWVGLTPKGFHNVKRFNKSLTLIQSKNLSFTAIAHACGYYDQAHFIKEFKSFAGLTPSQAALVL